MRPERFRYSAENCSIRSTLDIVGEKWTLLVLREAFYGVRRFDDFAQALGCARNILSARLNTLVAEDILSREPHRDCGEPVAVTMTCAAGHGPLTARDTRADPGAGARLIA